MQTKAIDTNADFDQLVRNYYNAWFRFHPLTAVDCGVDQYAGELAPISNSQMGALITLHEDLLNSFEEIDYQSLDADHQLDFDVLIGQVYLERQAMLQFDWRFRDPGNYLPLNAINQLLERPVKGFARALSSRLKAVPDHLWQAQELIRQKPDSIPYSWLEQAITSARTGDQFFQSLEHHPKIIDAINRGPGLVKEIETARKANQSFCRFLETEIGTLAGGDAACGEHRFNKLLQLKHGLDINHQQLYSFGLKLVESTYSELKQLCRKLVGHDDVAQLTAQIGADHPTSESLISTYSESMRSAKAFVMHNNLVSMPDPECLEVVETPVYQRHQIPFAAYMPPMFGDQQQQGFYYVTPVADKQSLAEHNFLSVRHTSVHEAFPGHHLQFATANLNYASSSLPRLLNTSATMYEGWALYCEQLMVEQGYLDQPLNQFILLKDRLWRALRVLIDVDLHVNQLPSEQAAQRLRDRLGFSSSQAMADISWYTHAPTVPMSYALGWSMINSLRDQQMTNDSFKLKAFHDKLLASGSISLAWVIKRQFGTEAMNNVVNRITA